MAGPTPPLHRQELVAEFMKRLQATEETKDPRIVSELFDGNAEMINLTRPNTHSTPHSKTSSALKFWSQYLHAFDEIRSHFTNVVEGEGEAALEWISTGTLSMGVPIEYSGVSVIEFEGDVIKRFRTYYDSAAFLPHAAHTGHAYSQSVGVPEMTDQVSS